MSVIGYVKIGNKIKIAGDGIRMRGSQIVSEDAKKIGCVDGKLFYGVTGLVDSRTIFEEYIRERLDDFCGIRKRNQALKIMKDFIIYCKEQYNYTDSYIKQFGSFMIINKNWQGIVNFDEENGNVPFLSSDEDENYAVSGFMEEYISALLDVGYCIEDAIKMASKKCNKINDHITLYELELD